MFIGRGTELQKLKELRRDETPRIAVLYGRRRVGKTYLINEAFKDASMLIFEGLEGQGKPQQIKNFLFQLKQQVPDVEIQPHTRDWSSALTHLTPLLKKKPTIIVLDELQWMASYRPELIIHLKMIWDQYLSHQPQTTLVLCGSIASFMIDQVVQSKALYGRIELVTNLVPFNLSEATQMLHSHGRTEVLESVLLLGGIPLYLKMIRDYPSVYLGINELAFRPNGFFVTEFNKIFLSHFGKKEHYRKIIAALHGHPYGMFREEISKACKIDLSGHLSKELEDLELAGFIKSYIPIDKSKDSKIKKYVLTDPYLRFYLTLIDPRLDQISPEKKDLFLKITQAPLFFSYLSQAFELFCQNNSYSISRILGFHGIGYTSGPYFRKELQKKGVQIDLLFNREDNVITLCEAKYSSTPTGVEVIKEVEKKVHILSSVFPANKTIQKVLIVKDAVTKDLLQSGYFYRIIKSDEFF